MLRSRTLMLLWLGLASTWVAHAQIANVQVNRENRTISVTAKHTLTVDAELAVLHIGYRNSGPDKDAVYAENLRYSAQIQKTFGELNLPDANIQTEKLRVGRTEPDEELKHKQVLYSAEQGWKVTVAANTAQTVIDATVRAGANDVSEPDWEVADPVALEAKANGAALAKAREIAEQMAKGLGAQLGDLIYASNTEQRPFGMFFSCTLNTSTASVGRGATAPVLKVYPKRVEKDATVVASFALK